MKIKNILFIILCILMIFTLTGCKSKVVKTTNDFISIAENHGYSTTDIIQQYASYEYIKEATLANSDTWQIEFYILDDESNAKNMFNTNKSIFENNKGNLSSEASVNMGNYSSYTLTSNGYYMYLCRVENTLLYVNISDEYKDEVKVFIDELGY